MWPPAFDGLHQSSPPKRSQRDEAALVPARSRWMAAMRRPEVLQLLGAGASASKARPAHSACMITPSLPATAAIAFLWQRLAADRAHAEDVFCTPHSFSLAMGDFPRNSRGTRPTPCRKQVWITGGGDAGTLPGQSRHEAAVVVWCCAGWTFQLMAQPPREDFGPGAAGSGFIP